MSEEEGEKKKKSKKESKDNEVDDGEKKNKKKKKKDDNNDENNKDGNDDDGGEKKKKKKKDADDDEGGSKKKKKKEKGEENDEDDGDEKKKKKKKKKEEDEEEKPPDNGPLISAAGFCDANSLDYFPLQEDIAYLDSKLADLTFMYNNLEDDHDILKRDYAALQHSVKNANIIARDQALYENTKTQLEITTNELEDARNLIKEMQIVGWDLLPEKLAQECKKANDAIDAIKKQREMAIHNESIAKTIANETMKKIKLSEGTLESQRAMIIDLKNVMDMAKSIREKEIKKLNREWETKLLRRHLRDKRRQATLQYQLEQMRQYLISPTEEMKQEILLESSLVYKFPSAKQVAKQAKSIDGKKIEVNKVPKQKPFTRGMWDIVALVDPEITEKLVGTTKDSNKKTLDSSDLTHPDECNRLITKLTKQIQDLKNTRVEKLAEYANNPPEPKTTTAAPEVADAPLPKEDLLVLEQENVQLTKKLEDKNKEVKDLKNQVKELTTKMNADKMDAKTEKEMTAKLKKLSDENKRLAESYQSEIVLRKKYFNMMEDMKGKIRVYCRVRPIAAYEIEKKCKNVVSFPDIYTIHVQGPKGDKEYQYDRVFNVENSQADVFEDTSQLLQSTVDGFNVCVFGYGQTGSGKTFTLIGNEKAPGLAPRSFVRLFELLNDANFLVKYTYVVGVTMLELYNDQLLDLLNENAEYNEKMEIKKNVNGIVEVPGSVKLTAKCAKDLDDIFAKGNAKRHIASTKMNSESSRSHLILSVLVVTTNKINGTINHGKFSIIDLAGSERISKSGVTGNAAKEAQSINMSLSALGDVISALSTDQPFVPYRNNKLTMLMQDSVGGNAKTLMFVNCSPVDWNASETISSLNYATRVKMVKNEVSKNADSVIVSKLKETIEKLKRGEPID